MPGDGLRELVTAHVRVAVPADWQDVPREQWRTLGPVPDADATAAMPGVPAGRFRPNVVVTSAPAEEPIEALSVRLLAETAGIEGWSRSLACDVWPHAHAPARRHEFLYALGGTVVLVTVHLLAVDGHRVDVTFSRAVDDAVALHDLGLAIGASVIARAEARS